MNRNIYILGSSGQLGSALYHKLINQNQFNVHCVDLDLTKRSSIKKNLIVMNNSVIINTAAYTNVDFAEIYKKRALEINSTSLKYISDICLGTSSTLIHFSTDYVFDGKSKIKYHEDIEENPINHYGLTKLMGEKNIMKKMKKYIILRVSWLYSKNFNNFPNTVIEMMKNNENICATNDQISIPTSIDFVTSLTIKILSLLENETNFEYGKYHLVPNGMCTKFELARYIRKYFLENKIFPKINRIIEKSQSDFSSKALRPSFTALNNEKIKNAIDFKIYGWERYLDEYLEKKYV